LRAERLHVGRDVIERVVCAVEGCVEARWCARVCWRVAEVFACTRVVPTVLIDGFGEGATRLGKLNHARLKVVQRSLDEAGLLFVVRQKVVPKWMLTSPYS